MQHPSSFNYFLMAVTFTLLAGTLTPSALAASTTPVAPVTTTTGTTIAAGSSEDSLQACLARIPKDATNGQRMIAEQSCHRDNGDRKLFQAIPSR